jgi:hypothetical protein
MIWLEGLLGRRLRPRKSGAKPRQRAELGMASPEFYHDLHRASSTFVTELRGAPRVPAQGHA